MEAPKVAVVTGASRGLGRRIAQDLVRSGLVVAANARSRERPGVGEGLYRAFDVSDVPSVDRFVKDAVSRFGRIDVLVNNAGFANAATPIPDTDEEVVAKCFEINLFGPAAFMRRVLPVMAGQPEGGVVVNIASRAGVTPVPGLAAYSASKSALVAFTLAAAKEYAGSRVLCVAVCPAGMNTEMRSTVYGADDAAGQMAPERVSEVVVELATQRTVNGASPDSGAAVVIPRDGEPIVVNWPLDSRGHQSLRFS